MNVVILYNPPTLSSDDPDRASEAGVLESVEAVGRSLGATGHRASTLAADASNSRWMHELQVAAARDDVVFNLCEAYGGRSAAEPYVAGVLELLGLAYTGSGPECLALARDKARTKWLLAGGGLPTAEFLYLAAGSSLPEERLKAALDRGPLLVKPAHEDASLGIGPASVARDWTALRQTVGAVASRFGAVLVERYLPGREFNVGVVALPTARPLPIAEIEFQAEKSNPWNLVTYDAKWTPESPAYLGTPVRCPAAVDADLSRRLEETALEAFRLLGCRDYARIDLRLDEAGTPHVLEINANPDIAPTAGLCRALAAAGIAHEEFAHRLVLAARERKRA